MSAAPKKKKGISPTLLVFLIFVALVVAGCLFFILNADEMKL